MERVYDLFMQDRQSTFALALRRMGHGLKDLVYPPSCIGCGGALTHADALCPRCWQSMAFIEKPLCDRYGLPLPVDHGPELLSPLAIADPPVFRRARAVARYDGLARDLVHRLKYGDRQELSLAMGRAMCRAGRDLIVEADLIVPVPLHLFRLWSRRFNQAALLAKVIADQTGKPMIPDALKRIKRTKPQVGLTRAERADNLNRAFAVNEAHRLILTGKRVLLIDDVMTTASTANVAARTLMKAGANDVDVLTFALVVNF